MFACSWEARRQKKTAACERLRLCLSMGSISLWSSPAALVSTLFAEAASSQQTSSHQCQLSPSGSPLSPVWLLADLLGIRAAGAGADPPQSASPTVHVTAGRGCLFRFWHTVAQAVLKALWPLPEY